MSGGFIPDPLTIQHARAMLAARRGLTLQNQPGVTDMSSDRIPAEEPIDPTPAPAPAQPPGAPGTGNTYAPLAAAGPMPAMSQPQTAPATTQPLSALTASAPKFKSSDRTQPKGNFFDKPQATDALTAFGAAMLQAPDFLSGLGAAATAVNQVDRENRMPTDEEIARANIKYHMANGTGLPHGRSYSPKVLNSGYDNRNIFWQGVLNADGTQTWTGSDGSTSNRPPDSFQARQDSGTAQRSKDSEKLLTSDRDTSNLAAKNIPTYNQILDEAATAGVGSSVLSQGIRTMSSALGIDIGDADLSDRQVLTKNLSNLELQRAQTQRGLGQFTEMERRIVKDSLPSMDTSAQTVFRVTVQMKLRDTFDQELYNDYMDLPPSERGDYEEYAYKKRREQKLAYEDRYKALVAEELQNHPEYQQYMGDKSSSGATSSGGRSSTAPTKTNANDPLGLR